MITPERLATLEVLAKAAEDPPLGDLVIEQFERKLMARNDCFTFVAAMHPGTALELIQSLRQCQEALAVAKDRIEFVATTLDDTDSTGTERFAYQQLRDSLARIEGILNG